MTINPDTTTESLLAARDQISTTFVNPFNSNTAVDA
jgi:hypothetical protein